MKIRLLLIIILINIFSSNGMAMESPLHGLVTLKTNESYLSNLPLDILADVVIKLLGLHTTLDEQLKEIVCLRLVNKKFNQLFSHVNAYFMKRILQTVRVDDFYNECLQDVMNKQLLNSAVTGQTWLVTILLQRGAEVNAKSKYLGENALHRAATNSHTEVAKLLIAYGANVNAQRNDGNTPLRNAIYWGSAEIVKLLVAHGARDVYNLAKNEKL